MLQILQVLEIKDLAPAGGSVMGVPQLDGNSHRRLVAPSETGEGLHLHLLHLEGLFPWTPAHCRCGHGANELRQGVTAKTWLGNPL